jgi:hypothetical protein|tara:strand:- start:876 stop:1079 length:204 start_codon:yes stop_codon:yes gene_type:complete
MFQDVSFLQNWHTGDRPNIELRCQGERMKFPKIIENSAKNHQNSLKSNENFVFLILKRCQRHLVAIY